MSALEEDLKWLELMLQSRLTGSPKERQAVLALLCRLVAEALRHGLEE